MITPEQLDEAALLSMTEEEAQAFIEGMRAKVFCKEIAENCTKNFKLLRQAMLVKKHFTGLVQDDF